MADIDDQHDVAGTNAKNLNSLTTATTTQIATAHSHPLQNVNLNQDDVDFVREMPPSNTIIKENWVKFDDDVNEIEVNNENKIKTNNNSNNLNNNNNNNNQNNNNNNNSSNVAGKVISFIDNEKNDTRVNATTTTTPSQAAATVSVTATSLETKNKLSALLPPPPQPATRSRTPTTQAESIQQEQRRARTPEQRSTSATNAATATTITTKADVAPAVLSTESTHVNLNASSRTPPKQLHQQHQKTNKPIATPVAAASSPQQQQQQQQQHHINNNGTNSNAISQINKATSGNIAIPVESASGMRTIELSTGVVREGFANGDVIVTLLPANTKWPWITPAIFRPELVPEELMAQGLTLTVEEYVQAMETLVNDYRFTFYNICYKRILVCWILFAFTVLLTLLFSGLQGVALFSLGVGWLFLNAAAIFICMWAKLRLSRGLEKCLARVNKQLMKHKILLVLDDRGRISCHKVNLCFLYFDATQCVEFLNQFLEHTEQNGGESIQAGWERKLDIELNDIVIQGSNPVRLSRKQALAQELFLSYLQRWGKDFLRRRLDFTVQEAGVHERPRHLQTSLCPCQYEEEVLRNKIKERGAQLLLRYGSRWGMEAMRGLADVTPSTPGRHCAQFQCPCQYIVEHLTCKPRGYPCSCIAYASDPQFQNRY